VAGFETRIDVVGLEAAQRVAQRVYNLGEDTEPLLAIAGSILEASTIRRFDTESGPGGIPWPKSRRAGGYSVGRRGPRQPRGTIGKTLTDTGDLRDSIRYELRPGEVEVGADGLKNPVKAIANQLGSHRQTVVVGHTRTIRSAFGVELEEAKVVRVRPHGRITNLPARPFVGVDDQDRDDLGDAWSDYLIGLLK
jgi:phage gpG-like protein